jgi:hypothetical protein
MKKFYYLFNIIAVLSLCTMFTSCTEDEDAAEAYVLSGEWTGDWKMSYTTNRGHTYRADYTDIVFYRDGAHGGYGYQVDFYSFGPYSEIYSRFTWSIENGTIYIDYPDDHRYDTVVYEYGLSDRSFYGYLGDSRLRFSFTKIVGFHWNDYYTYDGRVYDYYYWPNSDYVWDDGDYYWDNGYWSKARKSKSTTPSTPTANSNEPEQIVKIGSQLGEGN